MGDSGMTVVEAVRERVDAYFRRAYKRGLDAYEISDVPGYWRRLETCGGAHGGCHEPIHGFMFNEGGIRHTASYFDPPRVRGRFVSPTRTWRLLHDAERSS